MPSKSYIIDKRDENIKKNIIKTLQKEGHVTYSYILSKLKFKVTNDVQTAAYNPMERIILINPKWDIKYVSFIVRHEILHGVLKHFERTKALLGDQFWVEIDPTQNKARLWATDLELGDKGYTPEDVELAKETHGLVVSEIEKQYGIKLAGKSYEEIYQILYDKFKEDAEKEKLLRSMMSSGSKESGSSSETTSSEEDAGDDSGESSDKDSSEGEEETEESDDENEESEESEESEEESDESGSVVGPIDIDLGEEDSTEDNGEEAETSVLSDEDLGKLLDIQAELSKEAEKIEKEIKKESEKIAKTLSKSLRDAIDKITNVAKDTEEGELGEMSSETKEDLDDINKILDKASEEEKILDAIKQDAINATIDDKLKASSELQNLVKQHENEIRDIKSGFLYDFKLSLVDTLTSQIGLNYEDSYGKLNKTYDGTGIIKKGRRYSPTAQVPEVNVYIDRSGSWGPEVYAQGLKAVGVLDDLVNQGKIKVNVYYFSVYVYTDAWRAASEIYNSGQPVIDHIKATNPTNVVLMTDADIDYPDAASECNSSKGLDDGTFGHPGTYIGPIIDKSVEVPGKVWIMVPYGYHLKVADILQGRQGTEEYNLTTGKKMRG